MTLYKKSYCSNGVFVEAEITDGAKTLRRTDQLKNDRHKILVQNLNLYPAKFKCMGCIPNNPRNTKFWSPHPKDSDSQWNYNVEILNSTGDKLIDHIKIIPMFRGTDLITAIIDIFWPHPGRPNKITACIDCKTNL